MSVQDLERRIEKLEEDCETLREDYYKTAKIVGHYESMSSGIGWVFAILTGIAAFVASIKAVFGKLF